MLKLGKRYLKKYFFPIFAPYKQKILVMKKISIEILCDEFYTADSLHELAGNIECGDVIDDKYADENGIIEVSGDHYTANIKEVEV